MSELYTPVPDWFEVEKPLQPKKAVGDYVASEGILVPRRFETFEEAQFAAQSDTSVIARSEHPDEYSGPSGFSFPIRGYTIVWNGTRNWPALTCRSMCNVHR